MVCTLVHVAGCASGRVSTSTCAGWYYIILLVSSLSGSSSVLLPVHFYHEPVFDSMI